jgi:hypothetical protein
VTNLKRHLTAANVLSCMALFIALGGTAYAAVKLKPNQVKAVNIASQAVTNAKIKTQAVTSGKIKNGGVVNADLGAGAVTGSKIAKEAVTSGALAKNSVTNAKIGSEAVATGKIGNEAITSGKISAGVWNQLVKDVTYESSTSVNDSETEKNTTATCPQGKEAIGGGARINAPAGVQVAINGSYPAVASNNARTGWVASGRETAAEPGNWQVVAYVVCASL